MDPFPIRFQDHSQLILAILCAGLGRSLHPFLRAVSTQEVRHPGEIILKNPDLLDLRAPISKEQGSPRKACEQGLAAYEAGPVVHQPLSEAVISLELICLQEREIGRSTTHIHQKIEYEGISSFTRLYALLEIDMIGPRFTQQLNGSRVS
ncbi:MAG: hypothetical protein BWY82_02834 [Verrucomicrobia bacterium ADurb.Bin474]|nr:MAG: hypothetical protein BWY82_02834 [Verrucomicrobia bacterium ADurb.Bin474]